MDSVIVNRDLLLDLISKHGYKRGFGIARGIGIARGTYLKIMHFQPVGVDIAIRLAHRFNVPFTDLILRSDKIES